MTLGGYNDNRYDSATAVQNISFGTDLSRDLLLTLNGIKYDSDAGSGPLLTEKINILIDSMVSQIWLPIDDCKKFEDAFGLVWNASSELYLISEDVHSSLVEQSPEFTFTVSSGRGKSVDIVFPYAAFDLNMTQPSNHYSQQRYFPLKQAQNPSQYILGRVFLQEAYVVADYTRSIFSVGRARHSGTTDSESLVPIRPPGFGEQETTPESGSKSLSSGGIAGVVLVVILFLMAIVVWIWIRRRRERRPARVHEVGGNALHEVPSSRPIDRKEADGAAATIELDSQAKHEMNGSKRAEELDAVKLAQELDAPSPPVEVDASPAARSGAPPMLVITYPTPQSAYPPM